MNKFNKYTKALIVVDMVNGFVNEGVLHDKNIKNILKTKHHLNVISDDPIIIDKI